MKLTRECISSADKARFWSKVDKKGPMISCRLGQCWIWTGAPDKDGYGRMRRSKTTIGRGAHIRAHRVSWVIAHGRLPVLQVLHRCDNPACVRPSHLFLGTAADNDADRDAKGRQAQGESHGRAKVDWDAVCEIRRAYAAGEATQTELASKFGLNQPSISRIILYQGWKARRQ